MNNTKTKIMTIVVGVLSTISPLLVNGLDADGDGYEEAPSFTNPNEYVVASNAPFNSMTFWAEAGVGSSGSSSVLSRTVTSVNDASQVFYIRWVNGDGNRIINFYDDRNPHSSTPSGDNLSNNAPGWAPPISLGPLFSQMPIIEPLNPSAELFIDGNKLKEGDVYAVSLDPFESSLYE